MLCGPDNFGLFSCGDRFCGESGFVGSAAADFDEDDCSAISCDNVDLAVPTSVVGSEDFASPALEFGGGKFLAPFA